MRQSRVADFHRRFRLTLTPEHYRYDPSVLLFFPVFHRKRKSFSRLNAAQAERIRAKPTDAARRAGYFPVRFLPPKPNLRVQKQKCSQWQCPEAKSRSTFTSSAASAALYTAEPATKVSAPACAAISIVSRETPPST